MDKLSEDIATTLAKFVDEIYLKYMQQDMKPASIVPQILDSWRSNGFLKESELSKARRSLENLKNKIKENPTLNQGQQQVDDSYESEIAQLASGVSPAKDKINESLIEQIDSIFKHYENYIKAISK